MGETNMSFVTVFVVSLRVNLRSANLQAKDNMRKAAQEEVKSHGLSILSLCHCFYQPAPFEIFV
jgi:hypothetical protein